MSPSEIKYEEGGYWCGEVPYQRDGYVDEREQLESSGLAASNRFHPDPVDQRFLPADSEAYQHHHDVPMIKYLTPIQNDFQAAHRRNVHCRDKVFDAVIVDTASSLVTAEACPFALQSTLPDRQYVHQHLSRLQADSRTVTLKIIDRYTLGPGDDDVSAIIVVRRLSIADTP